MRRKALVIGAQTGGLSGVHHDVDAMTAILTERNFEVDRRTGDHATQAGIREGWQRLITDIGEKDAAVAYFSGHGNVARVLTPEGIALPELRFIVPTDYAESSPGDFRGITAIELSVSLDQLTRRTRNVTVILDCCHAARMVRDDDLVVKAWPHPTYLDIAEHRGMLLALGIDPDILDPIANKHAVRALACGPWESAYEYTARRGTRAGVFTDSLRVAIEEAGSARVTWSTLIQRVRDRVCTLTSGQRPEAEGPSNRLLFDEEEGRAGVALLVVLSRSNRVTLPGAALLGVSLGDEFGITPAGAASATEATMVARAVVTKSDGVTVEADLKLCEGHDRAPPLAEAHPLTTSRARDLVLVSGVGDLAEQLRAEVDAQPTLRAIGPADPVGDEPVLAEVAVADELSLLDGGPEPLARAGADKAGVDRVVADLRRLGRTAVLRRLTPGPGEALADRFTVEWGRVENGLARVLPPSGALLHAGESVYLRLRNESDRSLYFFVVDLGVAHAVRLVTADPSGQRLLPDEEVTVGEGVNGVLEGTPLTWPLGLPAGGPRPETLLVIVTTAQHDLSGLAHEGALAKVPRGSSPLARALATALGGAARDWGVRDTSGAGFAVSRVDFDLSPDPAPVPERAPFLIDERPHPSARQLRPRGPAPAPRTVAVRLTDLVVRRNRALGGADIRVDALVLTGGGVGHPTPAQPVYQTRTAWLGRVRDGDRLPLDNMLVYHGPAVDYLDLAWWVSRDRRRSRALSDMLRDRLTDGAVLQAAQSLSALAVGSPQAALAVTAVSACAIITNTAYELLSEAVGDTIGLYRTSLLASEGFGVGRHPTRGCLKAQDFSFAYEVVDAG